MLRQERRDSAQIEELNIGAPAWDREPRKARLEASVVFTLARGVIHPSFPLRGRWLRTSQTASKPLPPRLQSREAR
jgi:hypothetical protein